MRQVTGNLGPRLTAWLPDQKGITGLESAIVLIAFVVVSSVFAFAALSTGLFSSDKAKETISAGLAETRGHPGAERSTRRWAAVFRCLLLR